MVDFGAAALSPSRRNIMVSESSQLKEYSTRKRKHLSGLRCVQEDDRKTRSDLKRRSRPENVDCGFDIDLHLDIKKTFKDPRNAAEAGNPTCHDSHSKMNLDLELNLQTGTSVSSNHRFQTRNHGSSDCDAKNGNRVSMMMMNRCPSWLEFSGEDGEEHGSKKEHEVMVARVCMKCHMLVMLSKSSPVCPNCKFMHPREEEGEEEDHMSFPKILKPSLLRLLC